MLADARSSSQMPLVVGHWRGATPPSDDQADDVAAALSTALNAERHCCKHLMFLMGTRYTEGKSPVSEYFEEVLASVSELCVELDAFDPDRW